MSHRLKIPTVSHSICAICVTLPLQFLSSGNVSCVADGLAIPAGLTSITPANHVQELLKSIQYEKLPSENKIEPIKIRSDNLVQQDNRYSSFSCFSCIRSPVGSDKNRTGKTRWDMPILTFCSLCSGTMMTLPPWEVSYFFAGGSEPKQRS